MAVGNDFKKICSAIKTGNPDSTGDIWFPMHAPSFSRRHLPAAVKTPVLKETSTMDGMSCTQQRLSCDALRPLGLPRCPVRDAMSTDNTRHEKWFKNCSVNNVTAAAMSRRGTALKKPTRSSFHSWSGGALGFAQCWCNDCHSCGMLCMPGPSGYRVLVMMEMTIAASCSNLLQRDPE